MPATWERSSEGLRHGRRGPLKGLVAACRQLRGDKKLPKNGLRRLRTKTEREGVRGWSGWSEVTNVTPADK